VFDKCTWVAGIVLKFVAGKPITFDATSLAGGLIEVSKGRAKCKLCGRVAGLSFIEHHLQSKHYGKLLELLEKCRLRRPGVHGRGDKHAFNIQFHYTGCDRRHSVIVRSNTGLSSVRRLPEKLGLSRCPNCGKPFEVTGLEFG
jgi:hypothetical protein